MYVQLVSIVLLGTAAAASSNTSGGCKCFPGDACWPTQSDWDQFNSTVAGRLIATVPLGSPCHDPIYDAELCAALQSQWLYPGIHMDSSSSVMAPFFANQSCDPFQPRDRPCILGNYVQYAVNATGPDEIVAAVNFSRERNVRFVIRNTGHDYLGRSTGAGSLAIWTHHLKIIEPLDWEDCAYNGRALKLGAGVLGYEALTAAHELGLVVVSGECPTVGVAGGYTQGGGHSALSTEFGLAADNALSFEVVTSSGSIVTASRKENTDLYWALSGGGAGNYGVVVSMTVKAHADTVVSGATFTIAANENQTVDRIFEAVDAYHESVIDMVDAGLMAIYFFGTGYIQAPAITAYNKTQNELEEILSPFLGKIRSLGLTFSVTYTEFSSYYDHYDHYWGPLPLGNILVGTAQFGGRLILRDQVTKFGQAARDIAAHGVTFIGVSTNVSPFGGDNAVLPAWRDTVVQVTLNLPWNFTVPWSDGLEIQKKMTDVVIPIIEAATPGSGAYMNEADWRQPNFQEVFFGSNYEKLLSIKNKWDSTGLFYAVDAVGSEAYAVQEDGRLCSTT
ncbi:FAD binding domain-containing protein [Seiridium cupressi]